MIKETFASFKAIPTGSIHTSSLKTFPLDLKARAGSWYAVHLLYGNMSAKVPGAFEVRVHQIGFSPRQGASLEEARSFNLKTIEVTEHEVAKDRVCAVYTGRTGVYHQFFDLVEVDGKVEYVAGELPVPGLPGFTRMTRQGGDFLASVTKMDVRVDGTPNKEGCAYKTVPYEVLKSELWEFTRQRRFAKRDLSPEVYKSLDELHQQLFRCSGFEVYYDEHDQPAGATGEGIADDEWLLAAGSWDNIVTNHMFTQRLRDAGVDVPDEVYERDLRQHQKEEEYAAKRGRNIRKVAVVRSAEGVTVKGNGQVVIQPKPKQEALDLVTKQPAAEELEIVEAPAAEDEIEIVDATATAEEELPTETVEATVSEEVTA